MKSMVYTAGEENGPSWSVWQKGTQGHLRTSPGVLESGLLHPYWKRDLGTLWRSLSCFRSDWHQSTTASAGLDVQRMLHTCHWCFVEWVMLIADHTASLNRKPQLPRDLESQHKLAWRQKFCTNIREAGVEGGVLRRPHYIISTRKWETICCLYQQFLQYCRDTLKTESSCTESYVTNCRSYEWQGGSSQVTELKGILLSLGMAEWDRVW